MKKVLKVMGIILGLLTLFIAGGYILTNGEYSIPATIAQDSTLPSLTIQDMVLHGQTFGDPTNPVLIIVHGEPGADYRSLLPLQALADQYYVVFFDQRGSGLSPRVANPADLTFQNYLSDLDSIVDFYGLGKPVNLLGHSFGGQLVTAYIAQHPGKVDHVILAEPGPLTAEMAAQGPVTGFGPQFILPSIKTTFQTFHVTGPDDQAAPDFFITQMMFLANPGYWCSDKQPTPNDDWRFSQQANQYVTQSMKDAAGNQISLVDGVDQFANRILFMASSCDTVIGEALQRKQMKYFQNSEIQIIEQAGHNLFIDQPETSVFIGFLKPLPMAVVG